MIDDPDLIEPLVHFTKKLLAEMTPAMTQEMDQDIPLIRDQLSQLGVVLETKAQVQAALNLSCALARHTMNHLLETCEGPPELIEHMADHLMTAYGMHGLILRDRCLSTGVNFEEERPHLNV